MSITQKERRFPSATGLCDIVYRQWIPEEIRGAVVLVHGMSEYIARYDAFAKFLAENGFLTPAATSATAPRTVLGVRADGSAIIRLQPNSFAMVEW